MSYKGFTSVELRKPKRSKFELSHEKRLSTRMGKLTPIFISETMPNDTFNVNTEVMLRLAPLIAPIMHRVNVFVHFFFIPNRLLWEDWEDFITGGRIGASVTTPPIPPYFTIDNILAEASNLLDSGSVADYLGIPNIPDSEEGNWGVRSLDAMPWAAFYKVWYDYYRDRNFSADNDILPLASGSNDANISTLAATRYRSWQHDYFTSALPWTQRGDEVLMPLQGDMTVTYLDNSLIKYENGTNATGESLAAFSGLLTDNVGNSTTKMRVENLDQVSIANSEVSINDLRRAIRLQEWLERNALAGSRYNESIMAHFARKTSDSRLQRAEYLGGGKVVVKISEVLTTAFSQDGDTNIVPAGNMAGHGVSFGDTNRFSYNCEEHGFIIGIMSVMPTSAYMQGVPRMFLQRNTFLDYPWPSFAHLGEQEVYKSEIYSSTINIPVDRTSQPVFGYQSRYADWKFINSSSHGDFRSSLDFWHLTRKFSSSPTLGETFNTFEDTLQDRVFAVAESDTLWCYIYNDVSAVRSLPYFGTPLL